MLSAVRFYSILIYLLLLLLFVEDIAHPTNTHRVTKKCSWLDAAPRQSSCKDAFFVHLYLSLASFPPHFLLAHAILVGLLSNHNSNNKCVAAAYLLFYLHDFERSHTIFFATAYVQSRDIRIFVLFICFYFEDLACFIGCVRLYTSFICILHIFSPSLQFSNINNVFFFKDTFFLRNSFKKLTLFISQANTTITSIQMCHRNNIDFLSLYYTVPTKTMTQFNYRALIPRCLFLR